MNFQDIEAESTNHRNRDSIWFSGMAAKEQYCPRQHLENNGGKIRTVAPGMQNPMEVEMEGVANMVFLKLMDEH
jgi:hypothetical protein